MCAIIKKFIWEPFKASPVTCLVRLITAGFLGYVLYDGIDKVSFEPGYRLISPGIFFVVTMLYLILRVLGLWPYDSIYYSKQYRKRHGNYEYIKQIVFDVIMFFCGLQYCYYFFKSNTLPIWVYFFLAVVFGVGLVLLCERFNKKE